MDKEMVKTQLIKNGIDWRDDEVCWIDGDYWTIQREPIYYRNSWGEINKLYFLMHIYFDSNNEVKSVSYAYEGA